MKNIIREPKQNEEPKIRFTPLINTSFQRGGGHPEQNRNCFSSFSWHGAPAFKFHILKFAIVSVLSACSRFPAVSCSPHDFAVNDLANPPIFLPPSSCLIPLRFSALFAVNSAFFALFQTFSNLFKH